MVFLLAAIGIGITFLYGCVGEILTEKSGHLNLGIPGIMTFGATGGCFAVSLYMGGLSNPKEASWFLLILFGLLGAGLFGAALGGIYSFLTVSLRSNQNVTGLSITTFGVGLSMFLMESVVDKTHFARASKFFVKALPCADNFGWFGELFLSHGFLTYFAVALAVLIGYVLKKTRVGLNLRAVGENPATADAVGINVTRYKYVATCLGSAVAGFGGLYYVMDYLNGSWEYGIEAVGWLAIALVIFAMWRPNFAIIGSFVFGGLYVAAEFISGVSFSEKELLKLLPYVVTILVLIFTSVMNSKENQPPAALGLSYFREER